MIITKKRKQYLFMLVSFLISGVIVAFISNTFFVNNTPSLSSNIGGNIIGKTTSFLAFLFPPKLMPVAKGVYAGTKDKNSSFTNYKEGEADWTEYTFTVKGKEVKIRVPYGSTPPSQQSLDLMY